MDNNTRLTIFYSVIGIVIMVVTYINRKYPKQ